jgi:hypothetical protein
MLGPHSRRSPGERQRRCHDERAGPFATICLGGQHGRKSSIEETIYSDGRHVRCGNVGVPACDQSIVGLATGLTL